MIPESLFKAKAIRKKIITYMKRSLINNLLIFMVVLAGCTSEPPNAQAIIDHAIEAYGGQKLNRTDIEFDFRKIHYRCFYDNGIMSYERLFKDDSLGQVHDILSNEGFIRSVNNQVVELDKEWTGKYTRSVNSVIYFFRIPFNLNDPAVNKELLGETEINGQAYYEVLVHFDEEGGGEDHDDSFVYWFNKETFFIDYFAYSYSTDGGGKRFRVTINPRVINGLRVVDYINYEPTDLSVSIKDYENYYETGGMKELSRIENENVVVTYLE